MALTSPRRADLIGVSLPSLLLHTNQMNEISKNLYLGPMEAAQTIDRPSNKGKWFVLSIMESPPKLQYVKQLEINLSDHHATDISKWFDLGSEAILYHLKNGFRVLVHCRMGISRSASMVIAFLMRANHWSCQQAIEYVESKRPFINPNPGFMKQLKIYEVYLNHRQ
jgi:protein phosphatase slingshot